MKTKHTIYIDDSRDMKEVTDNSIDLIITSPPYHNVKYLGESSLNLSNMPNYESFLNELMKVWKECIRILTPQGKICIDVMDYPIKEHGFVTLQPLHSDIIQQFKEFDNIFYFSEIIWWRSKYRRVSGRKGSTGGGMWGSYPFPPTIMTHNIFEHILVFRKDGKRVMPSVEEKEPSRITKEQLYEFTRPIWIIEGVTGMKKIGHDAIFPDELVDRLIRMYSFVGDTVLDPFLGSGTTSKVALKLGRHSIGYEINPDYLELIKKNLAPTKLTMYENKVISETDTFSEIEYIIKE